MDLSSAAAVLICWLFFKRTKKIENCLKQNRRGQMRSQVAFHCGI